MKLIIMAFVVCVLLFILGTAANVIEPTIAASKIEGSEDAKAPDEGEKSV